MGILDWRRPYAFLCLLVVLAASETVSAGPNFSPSGPQKVLVVPIDLGSTILELCPDIPDCPLGILNNVSLYQPPRHTAAQWESLLNQYGTQFWGLASYGQAQVEFKALVNPARPDGWWTPPHSAQNYFANGNLFVNYKTWAETSDSARHAIDSYCSGLTHLFFCTLELPQYDRLVVMSNFKAQGGVSSPGPITLPTVTSGSLQFTMTLVNESLGFGSTPADSLVLATVMHEFGHQLGMPSHYGNCAAYNDVPVPPNYNDISYPFAPPAPPGYLECLQYWDIMGGHWRWPQPSGFSRWSRGWIDPKTTIAYQLQTAAAFNALHLIAPVETTPGQNGVPNLIRLSHGLLSDPWFYGYFVECRVSANGDEGLYPKSNGIPAEGLVITNVHESSIFDKSNTPPAHVVRPNFPGGTIDSAYLWPGGTFTDAWNMTIRFNGWAGGAGADRLCDVEIAYGKPLLKGPIVMWQNRVSPGPVQGTGLSTDVGINQLQPAPPAGGASPNPPLGMAPLWPNHVNTLFARAHTLGTLAAENVKLSVRMTQPAVIASSCGTLPDEPIGEIALPPVDPLLGATGALRFVARPGSLGVEIADAADPATGRAGRHLASTNFAYLFFPARAGRDGDERDPPASRDVAPAPGSRGRATRFRLRANPGCGDETSFMLLPGEVPEGWSVSVSPQVVSLLPGEAKDVRVRLRPPAAARPGDHAEVTVTAHQTEESPAGPADAELPIDARLAFHHALVGSIQVLGKVVGDPAAVELSCFGPPAAGGPLRVSGRIAPAPAPGQVVLEYRRGREKADARFVTTDATGAFRDRVVPTSPGPWRVRAFWPGDATHAPAQSAACLAQVRRHRRESSDGSRAAGRD